MDINEKSKVGEGVEKFSKSMLDFDKSITDIDKNIKEIEVRLAEKIKQKEKVINQHIKENKRRRTIQVSNQFFEILKQKNNETDNPDGESLEATLKKLLKWDYPEQYEVSNSEPSKRVVKRLQYQTAILVMAQPEVLNPFNALISDFYNDIRKNIGKSSGPIGRNVSGMDKYLPFRLYFRELGVNHATWETNLNENGEFKWKTTIRNWIKRFEAKGYIENISIPAVSRSGLSGTADIFENRFWDYSLTPIGNKFLHEQPIYTRIQNKYVQDEKQRFTKFINDFFHSVKSSTSEYAFQEVAEKMGYDERLPEEREAFILPNKSSNKRDSISFLKRSKAKEG